MIKIEKVQVKEASRVFADYLHKEAFNLSIDPSAILGAIAGGYAASRTYDKHKDKKMASELKNRNLENGTYNQVESILRDLRIVFTPISVVYSVNGQVFEIIKADEMNAYMKQAFSQKNANYFRDLLVNKINMEIQLAERAFAQRLLMANGAGTMTKDASYLVKQDELIKLADDEFLPVLDKAATGLEDANLSISPSLESLRPFDESGWFFQTNEFEKVAGIFDLFRSNKQGNSEDVGLNRFNKEINVGFLPDRVVFLWNRNLIDQLTLLHMNEEGYEAFRKRDKKFFLDLFKQHTADISKSLQEEQANPSPPLQKEAAVPELEPIIENEPVVENEQEEKNAASLEEIVDDLVEEELPPITRTQLFPFTDPDLHPLIYAKILADRYGDNWGEYELEAIIKQIEIDFELRDGLEEIPFNTITLLHTLSSEEHALFYSSLTFEKFMRGMNAKSIIFESFQGNLSFEEIIFGLEIAKAFEGDEVYLQFHDDIAPYVAEELMNDGIRFVSEQLYDQDNPSEKIFFKSVNGYLMRKWKELDAQGLLEDDEIEKQYIMAEQIVEISDEVLHHHADQIELDDPYGSLRSLLRESGFLEPVSPDSRDGVENMIIENVIAHIFTAMFIEYKHQELEHSLSMLEEEGVVRG